MWKSTLGLSIIRMLQGGTVRGKITFDGDSKLDMDESTFDDKFRWKKISMIFRGAMNSLDPVFTINEQFAEVLKQHHFEGDPKKLISDAMSSVLLDINVLKKYPHEAKWGNEQRAVIAMALLLKPKLGNCRRAYHRT